MKILGMMLAAVALSAIAALAQTTTTTTGTTGPVVTTVPVVPISTVATSAATCPTPTAACPTAVLGYPSPCAAKVTQSVTDDPVVLVLGMEERYALDNLQASGLNWHSISMNVSSITPYHNPLFNSRPNTIITRHGNPYYPYYEIKIAVPQVAGMFETFPTLPTTLTAESRTVLTSVAQRYRSLTPQQAMALGYQPVGACQQNTGQVYLNQALVDNRFDAMVPEAFTFDRQGRPLAAHYLMLADQPFMAYGQQFQSSSLVQGAQQLSVWLFQQNPNGLFAMQSTRNYCQ